MRFFCIQQCTLCLLGGKVLDWAGYWLLANRREKTPQTLLHVTQDLCYHLYVGNQWVSCMSVHTYLQWNLLPGRKACGKNSSTGEFYEPTVRVDSCVTLCGLQPEEDQDKWKLVTIWIGGNDLCKKCTVSCNWAPSLPPSISLSLSFSFFPSPSFSASTFLLPLSLPLILSPSLSLSVHFISLFYTPSLTLTFLSLYLLSLTGNDWSCHTWPVCTEHCGHHPVPETTCEQSP